MWPWEHLAFGYLLYSLYVHLRYREPPRGAAVVVLALATQFPDLVDKPLSWHFAILPSGTTLAHSLLVALPLSVLALVVAQWRGRPRVGAAFAIGYLSHLPGDVVYPMLLGETMKTSFLLWPLTPVPAYATRYGFFGRIQRYLGRFVEYLTTSEGLAILGLELGFLLCALAVWLYDGAPPGAELRRLLTDRQPPGNDGL